VTEEEVKESAPSD